MVTSDGTRALCIYKTSNGGNLPNQAIHSGMSVCVGVGGGGGGGSLHSVLWLVVLEVGAFVER